MKTKKVLKLAAATVLGTGLVMAGTAQATTYYVSSFQGSNLGDVRGMGGALIPELPQYTNCTPVPPAVVPTPVCQGSLDIQDPLTWQWMYGSIPLQWDYNNPTVAPTRVNTVGTSVNGYVTIVGGNVTAATLKQLDTMIFGMFQSWSVANGNGVVTDLVVNNLTWTYNPVTNTMPHSAAAGQGVCAVAQGNPIFGGGTGTQTSGQCGLVVNAVNNNQDNSPFQWDGIGTTNMRIADTQAGIYHTGTGATVLMDQQPGVTWDLSGFVEGVGGTITAFVVGKTFNNSNNGGVNAGLYTLHLIPVPVPAAVWLFGGALAALGVARRRKAAAA